MPRAAPSSAPVTTVAVVAFDGISPFHLSVPCLVFGEDRQGLGVPPYRLLVCAQQKGLLQTSVGFQIEVAHGLDALRHAGIVIVPSWPDSTEAASPALIKALQRAHARGAQIVGLCLGAFVLADAGLLDGRTASTHWNFADRFAARFPKVRLDPHVLYVDEGDVVTSAGTAASLDCCLHLLRQHCGAEAANRVARRLVVAPHRDGGQAQFIEQPVPVTRRDDQFSALLGWVAQHLDQAHSVDALADRAAMSRRTFTRRFRQATGTTLVQWLLAQRLARARQLLETTDRGVEWVALEAGFGSAVSLRQHFASALGTSPTRYRARFNRGSASPSAF